MKSSGSAFTHYRTICTAENGQSIAQSSIYSCIAKRNLLCEAEAEAKAKKVTRNSLRKCLGPAMPPLRQDDLQCIVLLVVMAIVVNGSTLHLLPYLYTR